MRSEGPKKRIVLAVGGGLVLPARRGQRARIGLAGVSSRDALVASHGQSWGQFHHAMCACPLSD